MVDGVFLNPNIHPDDEREKRWSAYRDFGMAEHFDVRRLGVPHEKWLGDVSADLEKPGRCRLCYAGRLIPVARLAREEGYDCFTTSLLLSIYQDHHGIAAAGEEASRQTGVPFLYRDFRVGYRRSREMARGRHIYMQKYCGCEFSLAAERVLK
jgi:predicted adenine nucleotide alpha hydrolase (AANH) superfamily ATPase